MKQVFVGCCAGLVMLFLASCVPAPVPANWTQLVKTEGQELPVPQAWLRDEEARIAHSLKLPSVIPKPIPFDFDKARWRAWLPNVPNADVQYFDHLCKTEAGEWIFKNVQNVEGMYFARPQGQPTDDFLKDLYGPEMPWIQRVFQLTGDAPLWQGAWFIQPPLYNYRYVEQPRREVKWQARIEEPYIRLFGYTTKPTLDQNGKPTIYPTLATPMEVVGVSQPTARYGYTWRGIKRQKDREHGIAGGEVLIYELATREVLAVRRQFLITGRNPRGPGRAAWLVAARCPQLRAGLDSGEFTQFAFDVLQTIEPSVTGKR